MTLSLIVLPNILSYIGKTLYLQTPTCLYKQFLDHFNIIQIVNSIIKLGFEDLNFLIPKVKLISKTIVFVNNKDNKISLAVYF